MLADPQLELPCNAPESLLRGQSQAGFGLGWQSWSMSFRGWNWRWRWGCWCAEEGNSLPWTWPMRCTSDQRPSRCPGFTALLLSPHSISCLSHCSSAPFPRMNFLCWTSCFLAPVCDCGKVLSVPEFSLCVTHGFRLFPHGLSSLQFHGPECYNGLLLWPSVECWNAGGRSLLS